MGSRRLPAGPTRHGPGPPWPHTRKASSAAGRKVGRDRLRLERSPGNTRCDSAFRSEGSRPSRAGVGGLSGCSSPPRTLAWEEAGAPPNPSGSGRNGEGGREEEALRPRGHRAKEEGRLVFPARPGGSAPSRIAFYGRSSRRRSRRATLAIARSFRNFTFK